MNFQLYELFPHWGCKSTKANRKRLILLLKILKYSYVNGESKCLEATPIVIARLCEANSPKGMSQFYELASQSLAMTLIAKGALIIACPARIICQSGSD